MAAELCGLVRRWPTGRPSHPVGAERSRLPPIQHMGNERLVLGRHSHHRTDALHLRQQLQIHPVAENAGRSTLKISLRKIDQRIVIPSAAFRARNLLFRCLQKADSSPTKAAWE